MVHLNHLFSSIVRWVKNGILFYWLSFFILIVIEFFIGGIFSKVLARENYSFYVNVLNTLPFYSILVNLGISYSISYVIAHNPAIRFSFLKQSFSMQRKWYLLLAAIHLGICIIFSHAYFDILFVTTVISYTYAYKLNLTAYFVATGAWSRAVLSNTLQKTSIAVAIAIIYFSHSLQVFVNGHFIPVYILLELGVVLFYFILFPGINRQIASSLKASYRKRIYSFGKYAMLNNGLNVLYYTLITLIIRTSELDTHLQIITGLSLLFFRYSAVSIAPVFASMSPQLTKIKGSTELVQQLYKKYLAFSVSFALLIVLGCMLCFSFVIHRFYAASYHDLPKYFSFYVYLIPLLFINSFHGTFLSAIGKIKTTTLAEIICTVILLCFMAWNFLSPVSNYKFINYMVCIHLVVKFIILSAGILKNIRKQP